MPVLDERHECAKLTDIETGRFHRLLTDPVEGRRLCRRSGTRI
jgi:hypothetical protein